jgi:hypothetical protein
MRLDRWFVRRELLDKAREQMGEMNVTINRMWSEKDDLEDDLLDARAKIADLEAKLPKSKELVTQDEYNVMKASRCANCGGSHAISCPRVKRMRFRPDGQTPVEVEFWRDDEWPKDNVKWLENLVIDTSPSHEAG